MLTTVTSWLWIDIHRHIHRSIILHTRPFQIYFVLSRFFLCHPSNQSSSVENKTGLSMSPVYIGVIYSSRTIDTHTYNHKHTLSTHTQTNTYFRKILEGKGKGLCRTTDTIDFQPPQVSQINTQVVLLWLVPNNQADSSFLHRVPPVRGGGGGRPTQPTRRQQQRQCHATKLDSQSSTQIV